MEPSARPWNIEVLTQWIAVVQALYSDLIQQLLEIDEEEAWNQSQRHLASKPGDEVDEEEAESDMQT